MAILFETNPATGGPGIEPRWTRSDKDGVGTAYSALSRVWFTVSKGILNEIYYPTIDRPQIRDLQYLITDGETFFSDERRLVNIHECLLPDALGFRITNVDPGGRYRITKEIITDPHQDCVLMHTRLEAEAEMLAKLRLFALLAPHLEFGGRGNFGNVVQTNWGKVLTAHKGDTWLVLAASVPFLRCSCGYVGTTDGWQDLAAQLPDGLGIRLCAGRQHRSDRGTRYPAEPGIRSGPCLRRESPSLLGHGCPGAGHFLLGSPRPLHRAVAACLPSPAAEDGDGDGRRRLALSRQPEHILGA